MPDPTRPRPRRGTVLLAALLCACAALPCVAVGIDPFAPQPGSRILGVDQALRVGPAYWDGAAVVIDLDIAPHCYLYRQRFSVSAGSQVLVPLAPPSGDTVDDPEFGRVEVWRGQLSLRFPAPSAPATVQVRYQGCADGEVCYTPQRRELPVAPLP